jgi:hypothetical protein
MPKMKSNLCISYTFSSAGLICLLNHSALYFLFKETTEMYVQDQVVHRFISDEIYIFGKTCLLTVGTKISF